MKWVCVYVCVTQCLVMVSFQQIINNLLFMIADNRPRDLQEFFDSTKGMHGNLHHLTALYVIIHFVTGKFRTAEVQKWAEALYTLRDKDV